MAKILLVFLSALTASSLALAENLECASSNSEVKLDLTEELLFAAHEDHAHVEIGKAFVYSLSYKDISVRYGQVSSEVESYTKTFDHEAAKFQIDGNTVLFLAETDAELLKFERVSPSREEEVQGIVMKLKLKSANIYFGRNINAPEKIESTEVPATTLLCTPIFSD